MSIIRKIFEYEVPAWINKRPRVPDYWSPLIQSIPDHEHVVRSLAFSPDGLLMASASYPATRVYDTTIWKCLQVLIDPEGRGRISFSPRNNIRLASIYAEGVLRLWDPANDSSVGMKCLAVVDTDPIFSADGCLMAVVCKAKGSVQLWDIHDATTNLLHTITELSENLKSVIFSPNGGYRDRLVGIG